MNSIRRLRGLNVIALQFIFLVTAACFVQHIPPQQGASEPASTTIKSLSGSIAAPSALHFHRLSFSPDDHELAYAEDNQTIGIYDADSGNIMVTLNGPKRFREVIFSPDGKHLAATCDDHTIRIWDAVSYKEVRTINIQEDFPGFLAWSPDSQWLATNDRESRITLWRVSTGEKGLTLRIQQFLLQAMLFTAEGQLVTATSDHKICLWDVSSGRKLRSFRFQYRLMGLDLSRNGKMLAFVNDLISVFVYGSNSEIEHAFLLNLDTGKLQTLKPRAMILSPFALSPDGSKLAFTVIQSRNDPDPTIRIYSIPRREFVETFDARGGILDLAFSPDGRMLAASGKTIRLWHCRQ